MWHCVCWHWYSVVLALLGVVRHVALTVAVVMVLVLAAQSSGHLKHQAPLFHSADHQKSRNLAIEGMIACNFFWLRIPN